MKDFLIKDNQILLKEFPTTRYQGSKRKIVSWIHEHVKDLRFNTVLDGFGGSSVVSYLFKKMGKEVTYNDKLYFNYLIGKALIENSSVKVKQTDLNELIVKNEGKIYHSLINTDFKNFYYLNKENRWLDIVSSNIIQMNHYPLNILEYKKAIAYYALFQSSIIKRPFNLFHRKNLNIRTNDVERNFGNKTTWEKPFNHYFKKFVDEANNLVFDSGKTCRALNNSIFDIDAYGYDLTYLDPPYLRDGSTNETADYLKCYHFLEGLAKYPEWKNMIDYDTINYRLKNIKEQNDFKIENAKEIYENLIEKFKNSIIVLSYKKGGVPSIDFLEKQMKMHKKKVYLKTRHYKYALNHQNGDAKKNREVLIIGI